MRASASRAVLCFTFALIAVHALGASTDSTEQARLALLSALARVTGGQTVSDVTLSTSVSRDIGTGTDTSLATMIASGQLYSRIDAPSSGVSRLEIWNASVLPSCQWTDGDGNVHASQPNNCAIPVWFFPALSPLAAASDPAVQVAYIGQENRNGETVDHYSVTQVFAPVPSDPNYRVTSQVEIYLDTATQIPVVLGFQGHSDSGDARSFPVEIRYSDYRSVSGVLIPFRIKKVSDGATVADYTVSSAVLNTGIPSSEFNLQ